MCLLVLMNDDIGDGNRGKREGKRREVQGREEKRVSRKADVKEA